MADPTQGLIQTLKTKEGLTSVNISGIRSQVVAPALIVRPYEPWFSPDRFCKAVQRYVAVATVNAPSSEDGIDRLYTMVNAVIDNLPEGWDWESIGGPVIDESTGTAFLAAPVRLTYKGEA